MLMSSSVFLRITECEISNFVVCKAYDMVEDLEGLNTASLVCYLTLERYLTNLSNS